jgi:hypothetical protein
MNTYIKYCANVYLAQCETEYQKGDLIIVTTKYGKENEHVVHNLVGHTNAGYFYSITRADGYNVQEKMKRKVELYENAAINADKKSHDIYTSLENRGFLSLGEPIKVGHHSEKRHRALLERNDNKMRRSYEEMEKAQEYRQKAKYLANDTDVINLSMPESLEYYTAKLEKTKAYHLGLKDGSIERKHGSSLAYANKAVKDLTKNVELATKLWG